MFDITIIGDVSKDRIVIGGKTSVRSGGAVLYGSIPIAKISKVGVITKVAPKDIWLLDEMKQGGIHIFPIFSTKTTEFENIYPDPNNLDKRVQRVRSVADPFRIKDIPEIQTKIFHIAPLLRGVITLRVVKRLAQMNSSKKRRPKISLEIQGFIRKLNSKGEVVPTPLSNKKEILSCVDILKTDRIEAEFLTNKKSRREAAQVLASYGPKEILITSNEGVLVYARNKFFKAPFTPRRVRGRTGRGDTCIAAYLYKRITSSPEQATHFAAHLTSLKLETSGPLRYPHI
ncbi:PfkB family carbohydrate kinase [Patescibacteria group bacterium AH-259-L05]|nr:PfkB family carbohydrate kinase [Patescibacteria group bacterium AH-259-L05]